MHPYEAYQAKNRSMTRIELILATYRKAMENLGQARAALAESNPEAARPFLVNAQLIVSGLSAELPAYDDEAAANFLRLYEFVAHQMAVGTAESVEAAIKVLRPLMEGFEAVHEQALTIEAQGLIPPLDAARQVSVTA